MNHLESIAAIIAVFGIVFTILENRICWLVNIVASILYFKVFLDSGLPGQMLLQVLYILVGVFGFYSWGKQENYKIKQLDNMATTALIFLAVISGYLAYLISDNLLWDDISLTIASIIATYLTTKKYIENWIFWIIINFSSIALFISKDLQLTAALYFAYATLGIVGLRQWSKQLSRTETAH